MGKRSRIGVGLLVAIGLYMAGIIAAPQLLAFPYFEHVGNATLYAEQPIDKAAAARVMARVDALMAAAPLTEKHRPPVRIFLTDGGWRWRLMALQVSGSFGLTRPLSDAVSGAVLLNRSSLERDRIWNRRKVGGTRSLSGTIAHEMTHMLVRRHFGLFRTLTFPTWKAEGYSDFVARESALSDADVARLRAAGQDHPALLYYEGRRRVAAMLASNGNNVDALFDATVE